MFNFLKAKKAEVLNHWYVPVPHYTAPPGDFYAAVERELAAEKVPDLAVSRVDFTEGGPLSDKRQYLRMTRERLVFDICAAPFGTNFFYSCRFAEIPANISFVALLLFSATLGLVIFASLNIFGFWFTVIVGSLAFLVFILTLRNAVSMGLNNVDAWLLKQPLFGGVYERLLRKETYYREDTRLMYLTIVEGVVKRLVERETAAKGITLLTKYERSPILGELYKMTIKTLEKSQEQALPHIPA